MFTGIIQKVIPLENVLKKNSVQELVFHDKEIASSLKEGDSVAVDGICTTVCSLSGSRWSCEIGRETLEKTTADDYRPRINVNIEHALRVNDRLNGHIVTGHVDGTGRIISITPLGKDQMSVLFSFPPDLRSMFIYKGSVALQGVSLTLNEVNNDSARVNIVSYTYHNTTFKCLKERDRINIETDLLGKYVLSYMQQKHYNKGGNIMDILTNSGYL